LLFVKRSKRIWFIAAAASIAFIAWAAVVPNDRYLLSFYDLLIATAGGLAVAIWELGFLARLGVAALVALQLIWSGEAILFYGSKPLRAALDIVAKGHNGKVRFKGDDDTLGVTQATPEDAVILARNYRSLLGLDRMVLSDVRAGQFYISYTGLQDASELWKYLRDRGVTHLLYPEGKRPPVRLNNTVLFAELFHHYATKVQHHGDLILGTLPATAPPPTPPLLVLTRSARGYPDGIYRVDQLVLDSGRAESGVKPKPSERYADENAADLLDHVQVVVAPSSTRWPKQVQSKLSEDFESVETFPEYAVHLRRQ
jgi:hypothetical protein